MISCCIDLPSQINLPGLALWRLWALCVVWSWCSLVRNTCSSRLTWLSSTSKFLASSRSTRFKNRSTSLPRSRHAAGPASSTAAGWCFEWGCLNQDSRPWTSSRISWRTYSISVAAASRIFCCDVRNPPMAKSATQGRSTFEQSIIQQRCARRRWRAAGQLFSAPQRCAAHGSSG